MSGEHGWGMVYAGCSFALSSFPTPRKIGEPQRATEICRAVPGGRHAIAYVSTRERLSPCLLLDVHALRPMDDLRRFTGWPDNLLRGPSRSSGLLRVVESW